MKNRRFMVLVLALLLSIGTIGCSPPAAAVNVATSEVVVENLVDLAPNLSVDEVAQALSDKSVVIVDVREDYEYAAGHIPGAVLIPLGEITSRTDEIPSDVPVVLVCRSGNRSGQAYDALVKLGFDNVHNMLGGMNDWSASGYEVEK